MSRIKIVWICHFSNRDIREKLPLLSYQFSNQLKKMLAFGNQIKYKDFASWISILITEFEIIDEVELHIIAPHRGLKRVTFDFELNNIQYHFFRPALFPLIQKFIYKIFKQKRSYWYNRLIIKKLLRRINPDIVNLFGAENPYYSISALDIKETPLYILLQTVLSIPIYYKLNIDPERKDIEKKIFLSTNYFGTIARIYNDCVINTNPFAKVFEFMFPTDIIPLIESQEKHFDFVFYSSYLSEDKGVEDAIEAFKIVCKTYNNAKLNIIGSCITSYREFLEKKIAFLGLTEKIAFSGYFPLHADMLRQVKKAKIALLPHKFDVISSTIREAMFLGLPIVTYKTTGTPFLNSEKQTVLISVIGDIEDLARNMLKLMNDQAFSQCLVENAKSLAESLFNNNAIAKKLIENNRAIINHYRFSTPIPKNLLFNIDHFPIY